MRRTLLALLALIMGTLAVPTSLMAQAPDLERAPPTPELPALLEAHTHMKAARYWAAQAVAVERMKAEFNAKGWVDHPFQDPATGRATRLDAHKAKDQSNAALDASIAGCQQRAEQSKAACLQILEAQGVGANELEAALAEAWGQIGPPEWRVLCESMTMQLAGYRFREADWTSSTEAGDALVFTLRVTNNRPDAIRAAKGRLLLVSIFDEPILTAELELDEGFAPGVTVPLVRELDFNQFIDEHQTLYRTDPKDVRALWVPEMLILADGRRVVLPPGDRGTVVVPWEGQLVRVAQE